MRIFNANSSTDSEATKSESPVPLHSPETDIGNGAPPQARARGPAQDKDAVAKLAAVQKSIAFTQIVSLMIRSPQHRAYTLSDLEWLFLPALKRNQFKIAEAKINNMNVPAGFLLWASVSPEVDKRLTDNSGTLIRLNPEEWTSGNILWLIETVGDPRAMRPLLKAFRDEQPNGRSAKVRITSTDGKQTVVELSTLNVDADANSPLGSS